MDNAVIYCSETNIKPDFNISFHQDGKLIGKLDFNGPALKFEGPEPEESAKVFMGYLSQCFSERLAPPEGWKLVPVIPTDEMLTAGINAAIPAVWIDSISGQSKMHLSARYSVMLAAAPETKGGEA